MAQCQVAARGLGSFSRLFTGSSWARPVFQVRRRLLALKPIVADSREPQSSILDAPHQRADSTQYLQQTWKFCAAGSVDSVMPAESAFLTRLFRHCAGSPTQHEASRLLYVKSREFCPSALDRERGCLRACLGSQHHDAEQAKGRRAPRA